MSLSGISLFVAVYKIGKRPLCFITTKKAGDPRQQPSGMTLYFILALHRVRRGNDNVIFLHKNTRRQTAGVVCAAM